MIFLIFTALAAVWFIAENRLILNFRRKDFGGNIRIMHISDIHHSRKGRYNCRISAAAEKEKPDLIFITGDFISRSETDFNSAEILLKRLCSTAPVYMVSGNHEQSLPEEMWSEFIKMAERAGAVILDNGRNCVMIKGRQLYICGTVQKYTTYRKDDGYKNLDRFTLNDMKAASGEAPDGEILLLAHNPLWAEVYAEWGADYAFSGHIHGGAVRFFGIGILSPERKFFPEYSKGIYDIGGMKLCVSAGIGKIRLFNPPEIVIYAI
ncbi:MAG: metallophosphoesterase [Ruminococcus sp.]|nr:metallophosphoesterase [Ruminococcus sp.]MDE6784235.1 metallophosphoesterase [Ruminococcus sp.]